MIYRIYIDEAGISAREPVSVVAGVVVRDENDVTRIEEAMAQVRRHVPTDIRDGFLFHASDIFHRKKGTPATELGDEARGLILKELMAIPRMLALPLAIGYSRRGEPSTEQARLGRAKVEHIAAFGQCLLATADFIRRFAPGEIVDILAEDCHDMRGLLRELPSVLRRPEMPEFLTAGIPLDCFPSAVQFLRKGGATPLQLADSIAFAVRRYIEGRKHGDTLFQCLTGSAVSRVDLHNPGGRVLFAWRWRSHRDIVPLPVSNFPYGT